MARQKPWLKSDGTLKSTEELKICSQTWPPSVWEKYLKTLEGELKEILLDDPIFIEELSRDEYKTNFQDLFSVQEFPVLKRYLLDAIKELTPKQQKVLNRFFMDRMNLLEIGNSMGISSSAVSQIRDRALKKLSWIFLENITLKKTKTQKKVSIS